MIDPKIILDCYKQFYEQQQIKFGKASRLERQFCRTDCSQTVRNLKKRLKTQNHNGPIYLTRIDFSKQMHDLRDIWVSFRDKFQVAEINSDAQAVHSFYKYMRKIRAMEWKNWRGGF
jgi:hypothetical protein